MRISSIASAYNAIKHFDCMRFNHNLRTDIFFWIACFVHRKFTENFPFSLFLISISLSRYGGMRRRMHSAHTNWTRTLRMCMRTHRRSLQIGVMDFFLDFYYLAERTLSIDRSQKLLGIRE